MDKDPHAAAAHLCHQMIPLSTHDPMPIIQALQNSSMGQPLGAVLNRSSGPPVVTAAVINQAFGLPGVPAHRARQILNKDLMREECERQNLSVVKHQTAEKFSDLCAENIPLPCVMKPALSLVGKHGVVVVETSDHLAVAFDQAKSASMTGKVLVEDYLPGHDVSVIGFFNHGKLEILALLDEINQLHSDGTVSGRAMAVPSRFANGPQAESITQLTQEVAEAFELQHTPLLLSCRVPKNGRPQLMEIHLDMGGDKIMDVLLPAAGQFDALQYMIQAQASPIKMEAPPHWNPTAVVFQEGAGLISDRTHHLLKASSTAELEQLLGEVPKP